MDIAQGILDKLPKNIRWDYDIDGTKVNSVLGIPDILAILIGPCLDIDCS
jgi:hypothetical protein